MRFGLLSPVVVQLPGSAAPWEADAGAEDLVVVAEHADLLGYHHLTCSEHVGVPPDVAASRGSVYWDPLATLSYLAARTRHIRLVTNVLVLGYHHPLALAKSYGTLDLLSGGRVVLGVGVGSLREEFDLLGASFGERGERADDALRALRVAWGRRRPRYHGHHYTFDDVVVTPCAPREDVSFWVGGRTRRSLRRAVELGEGWMPFGLAPERVRALLGTVEPPAGFDVVLHTGALDPLGDPEATLRAVTETRLAGATMLNASFVHHDREHLLAQLTALTELFPSAGWARTTRAIQEVP
ncbi:LLM class F420-dependent oxidoreductase [Prauserella marina]|uniref:Probable F420-dependent oxidoreductase, Rv2161c family n=1 Tax=Prauserella marina TaxID=530584 RepID=A0A222VQY6_9PSEU|nr:TIGR03619 family F420-dependent LLM class oxidoreductase [Prauserella marina]ASR36310.1 LLM class F420-dependent oxidoreductase [Prauserella marina]PWV77090.1 putative F420-dependent oxidoreductase [Prauserella marina]SDD04174.1 probable F420-dependent oxidoreductase, Rv2161c family [Prauserella marina]